MALVEGSVTEEGVKLILEGGRDRVVGWRVFKVQGGAFCSWAKCGCSRRSSKGRIHPGTRGPPPDIEMEHPERDVSISQGLLTFDRLTGVPLLLSDELGISLLVRRCGVVELNSVWLSPEGDMKVMEAVIHVCGRKDIPAVITNR